VLFSIKHLRKPQYQLTHVVSRFDKTTDKKMTYPSPSISQKVCLVEVIQYHSNSDMALPFR
jgi:hypothetical protein